MFSHRKFLQDQFSINNQLMILNMQVCGEETNFRQQSHKTLRKVEM